MNQALLPREAPANQVTADMLVATKDLPKALSPTVQPTQQMLGKHDQDSVVAGKKTRQVMVDPVPIYFSCKTDLLNIFAETTLQGLVNFYVGSFFLGGTTKNQLPQSSEDFFPAPEAMFFDISLLLETKVTGGFVAPLFFKTVMNLET